MNTTPTDPSGPSDPDGRQIEQMAREAIGAHALFYSKSDRFKFTYREGVLEILGTADSFYRKQVLQTVIQSALKGICRIDNQVSVVSSQRRNGQIAGPQTDPKRSGRPASND